MAAIFSIKCASCGKTHRISRATQPETLDQLALEAVLAGWGYSMVQSSLILICSFPCGQGVMTKKGTPRKRLQHISETSGGFA